MTKRLTRMLRLYGIWMLLPVLAACSSPSEPNDLLAEDLYIDILAELHLLYAIEQSYQDSTLKDDVLDRILEEYNITRDEFNASHQWYLKDFENQRKRLQEANERIQTEFDRLSDELQEARERRQR